MFEIFPIRAFSDNYIWMLIKDDEVTVVDPGDSVPVINLLNEKNLNLNNIIITHHHFDHTGGIQKLNEVYDCDVYGPSQGHIQGINMPINDNQEFVISNTLFKAIATPGHTLDHLSYFIDQDNEPLLLSGDTLFSEDVEDYLKVRLCKCMNLYLNLPTFLQILKCFVLMNILNQI